jgi:ubiquinone/menaquinone biosynthesis C-methylase UbiE
MKNIKKEELERIWARVPTDYYFNQNWLQRIWHERKWSVIRGLTDNTSQQPDAILEIGCAAGHLTKLISEHYPKAKVTGIDVYKAAIYKANRMFPKLTFLVADAHKLPFPENSFDLVISSETIEHVVDPQKMLSEIARVLKPTGNAIIEMDSGNWLFRLIWWFWTRFGKGKVWQDAHLHPFTASQLDVLITQNGLIVKKRQFSHLGMAVSFLISPIKH